MSGMLFLPREQNDQELRMVIQRIDYEYERRHEHLVARYELDEQYHRDMEQAYSEFWEVAHD